MASRSYCILYSTHPSAAQARKTARALLAKRHAACCNILGAIESHYRWQEKLTRSREVAMLSKTTAAKAKAARATIRALHPYDTPAILQWPITGGDTAFLAWISAGCRDGKG